jgi:2',3'-cyclic-nucleotide 2'-phosphodiesterase (5'-nucleotidase family)
MLMKDQIYQVRVTEETITMKILHATDIHGSFGNVTVFNDEIFDSYLSAKERLDRRGKLNESE